MIRLIPDDRGRSLLTLRIYKLIAYQNLWETAERMVA